MGCMQRILKKFHMELWLMNCKVVKREMEYAKKDELAVKGKAAGL